MKRQQSLQHRLQTLSALQEAVGAMRSLSAHHFRLARQTLPAARAYRDDMDTIIAEIGIHQPLHLGVPAGMLVVASDLGLCGDYNSRLSQLAMTESTAHAVQTIYSIGRRTRGAMARRALTVHRMYDAPASLKGLSQLLLGVSQDVLEDYMSLKIGSLHVVSARFDGVGHFRPVAVRLLPIESMAATVPLPPTPYVDSQHLTGVAVREFLYITLHEILLDALAAEHGMRLMAAEAALEWLEKTAELVSRQLRSAHSEAATQELLDIVAGGRKRLRDAPH